jgi:hypothetical protein
MDKTERYIEGVDYMLDEGTGPSISTDREVQQGILDGTPVMARVTVSRGYTDYDPESPWDDLDDENKEWWVDYIVRDHALALAILDYPPRYRQIIEAAQERSSDIEGALESAECALSELPPSHETWIGFILTLWLDGASHEEVIKVDDLDAAIEVAEERAQEWAEEGDWGDDGAKVTVHCQLFAAASDPDLDDPTWEDQLEVDIEPNHHNLILAAGGDPDCDHEWTADGEGGIDENPGVWSGDGTGIVTRRHCRLCGLRRT